VLTFETDTFKVPVRKGNYFSQLVRLLTAVKMHLPMLPGWFRTLYTIRAALLGNCCHWQTIVSTPGTTSPVYLLLLVYWSHSTSIKTAGASTWLFTSISCRNLECIHIYICWYLIIGCWGEYLGLRRTM